MIDISTNDQLAALCSLMKQQAAIAVDTEFIREKTYFPVLALIQVAWPEMEPQLIDPISISDWAPFHELLLDESVCKIFHAGRQDLEIFFYMMKKMPKNCFDTQIAASLCGYGEQISYSGLVGKVLNIHLAKGNSYTNWLQRPLSEDQLKYARDDVRYLNQIHERMLVRAKKQGRLEMLYTEIGQTLHEALYLPQPEELWKKVKKAGTLRERDLVVLRELAIWRDRLAREIDKPVRFVVPDEVLIELAKIPKLSEEQLRTRRGLHPRFIERYGVALLELHNKARALSKTDWPAHPRQEQGPTAQAESLSEVAWLLLKEIARKQDMAPANLILKRDLAAIVDGYLNGSSLADSPVLKGWRYDLVAEPLRQLLDGQLCLRIRKGHLHWEQVSPEDHKDSLSKVATNRRSGLPEGEAEGAMVDEESATAGGED